MKYSEKLMEELDRCFDFLKKVELCAKNVDKIDLIYSYLDDHLISGNYTHVENVLYVFEALEYFKEWEISCHISMLTVILPAKSFLMYHKNFVDSCRVEFWRRGKSLEEINDLLAGLE